MLRVEELPENSMKGIVDKIIKLVPLNVWKKVPWLFRIALWIKSKIKN